MANKQTWVLAFYELDRCYGGPEEGGWWYNAGTLVRAIKVLHNEDEAYAYCRRANHLLHLVQSGKGRTDIYSMAYRGGQYGCDVFENTAPPYFPESRPYYE